VGRRKKGDDSARDSTEKVFVMDAGNSSLSAGSFRSLQKEEPNHLAGAETSAQPSAPAAISKSVPSFSTAQKVGLFAVVQHVRPFPFDREGLVTVAVIVALPILPLTLTMFSFQELVGRLLKVLF
jgi:hypothetical protein